MLPVYEKSYKVGNVVLGKLICKGHLKINTGNMGMFYVEEHLNCDCYSRGEFPAIDIVKYSKGEREECYHKKNSILFVLSGKLTVSSCSPQPKREVTKGNFVFAAVGTSCFLEAMTDVRLLMINIGEQLSLCQSFNIEKLFINEQIKKDQLDLLKFKPLNMKEPIWDFVNVLERLLNDQLKCINFFQIKIEELLILLRAYYSKEELHDFFYYILNPNTVFIDYVHKNWIKYATVADLATAMNMSAQHFARKFKEIFKQPPGEWMKKEKANLILKEIKTTNKPFQEISDQYGFSAQSHFNRFCRSMFGTTPNVLRNQQFLPILMKGKSKVG